MDWVLDSACTFHICPNRDWITTYEVVLKGVVTMENNAPSKIVGIGSVKIKIFDGAITTLTSRRHVLDLKRNLISLSAIDSKEYNYTNEGRVLKINRDALVVMKGKRSSTCLYVLWGSMIIGDATTTTFSLSDEEVTKLLHIWLEHMCENRMAELSKRGHPRQST